MKNQSLAPQQKTNLTDFILINENETVGFDFSKLSKNHQFKVMDLLAEVDYSSTQSYKTGPMGNN